VQDLQGQNRNAALFEEVGLQFQRLEKDSELEDRMKLTDYMNRDLAPVGIDVQEVVEEGSCVTSR